MLAAHDITLVRAPNGGPFTLEGTNSWLIGRDGAYLIDPGPAIDEHVDALVTVAAARGGLAAILVTHEHSDHAEAVAAVRERTGASLLEGLRDGERVGPLTALATPGHAPEHLAFLAGRVCFSGDFVLGRGSVFIAGYPGAMRAYLDALARLRALDLELIAPGHGPLVRDPAAKLDEYIAHRLRRERDILDALADGVREREALLARVYPGLESQLRPIASLTLDAHLDKLAGEGRLPADLEPPPAPLEAPSS